MNKCRRRDAIGGPSDLAAAFPAPDARLTPFPCRALEHGGNNDEGGATSTSASAAASAVGTELMLLEGPGGGAAEKSTTRKDLVVLPADERQVTKTTESGDDKLLSPLLASAEGSKETRLVVAEGGAEQGYNPHERRTMSATIHENEKHQEQGEKENKQAEEERALASPLAESLIDGHTATGPATMATTAALPPLEASIMHAKLEGTASREKRQKLEKRLAKKASPVDPPENVDLARRRGGLGGSGEGVVVKQRQCCVGKKRELVAVAKLRGTERADCDWCALPSSTSHRASTEPKVGLKGG